MIRGKWLWAVCAVMTAVALAGPARAEAEYRWKVQSLWQAGTINQQVFEAFCERVVEITDGTGVGQRRVIKSNTATVLRLFEPWDVMPTMGSR